MQSGKNILVVLALAIALFAVLQVAESKAAPEVEEKIESIEKHVDDEIKKLIKRAADDDDDGGSAKHKKSRRRKASSTLAPGGSSTSAPSNSSTSAPASSTTAAPANSSSKSPASNTTKTPATTTKAPTGSSTTKAPVVTSTTKSPVLGSTTKIASTGSSSTPSPGSNNSTTADPSTTKKPDPDDKNITEYRDRQSRERKIIKGIYRGLRDWMLWLESNEFKSFNPRAAKAAGDLQEKIKRLMTNYPKIRVRSKMNDKIRAW